MNPTPIKPSTATNIVHGRVRVNNIDRATLTPSPHRGALQAADIRSRTLVGLLLGLE